MGAGAPQLADLVSVALTAGLFFLMFWSAWRRRRRRIDPAKDESAGTPYRVYDRSWDLELSGDAVATELPRQNPDRARGWAMRDPAEWRRAVTAATALADGIDAAGGLAASLRDAINRSGGEHAICFLVDQSGSMRGEPILHVAALLRWLSARLAEAGVACGILGFSTVGWQGGNARRHWLHHGQPKRPGRLCATLHLIYQPIGGPLTEAAWQGMLHPDVLRENVDGEAVDWALSQLLARPEANKTLMVISDGAPVDDATLSQNGLGYLERHLRTVLDRAQTPRSGVQVAAIGVGYAVDGYYHRSRTAAEPGALPAAAVALVSELLGENA